MEQQYQSERHSNGQKGVSEGALSHLKHYQLHLLPVAPPTLLSLEDGALSGLLPGLTSVLCRLGA